MLLMVWSMSRLRFEWASHESQARHVSLPAADCRQKSLHLSGLPTGLGEGTGLRRPGGRSPNAKFSQAAP
jgi:hypothetical protein